MFVYILVFLGYYLQLFEIFSQYLEKSRLYDVLIDINRQFEKVFLTVNCTKTKETPVTLEGKE